MTQSSDNFPPAILRLFLSVDIVGSTAFKQSTVQESEPTNIKWLEAISGFFTGFERALDTEWQESLRLTPDENIKNANKVKPKLWKALGDEAIYQTPITHPLQPLFAVISFRKAADYYRNEIREFSPKLDVKAAAWIAGFPVNNAEVVLGGSQVATPANPKADEWWTKHYLRRYWHETGELRDGMLDFIGPQMDLGFRLCSKSTPRKMVLSVDLTLMLIDTFKSRPQGSLSERFLIEKRIRFEDTTILKGAISGIPYPIFWLDYEKPPPLSQNEDKIRGRGELKLDEIEGYCISFIEDIGKQFGWVVKPFILDGDKEIYGKLPEKHREGLDALRERWRKDKEDVLNYAEDVSGESDGDQTVTIQELFEQLKRNLDSN